jgi:hypothetical protein
MIDFSQLGQRPEESSMTSAEQNDGILVLFCKYCGTRLQLSRIEPSLTPGYDRMCYECRKCGHSLTKETGVAVTSNSSGGSGVESGA